jgi:EAL domain-containing protein (putative c-di-GMP-specific phosphodiesterase class I)
LHKYLKQKTQKYNINPSRVTLEILENITIEQEGLNVVKQIDDLKQLGFKVAIDDFGTANANFSRLMELNFDYIKLDGIFIKDLDKNKKQQKVVKSIVKLAKILNVKTVAEFVENKKVLDIVKEYGIDMVQGYYFSKPCDKLMTG